MSEFGKVLVDAANESLAIARGKKAPVREVLVSIPDRIDAAPIRKRLDMSQAEFAATFGLNLKMVQKWERGQVMSEAAKAYLTVIDRDPEAVRLALQAKPGKIAAPRKRPAKRRRGLRMPQESTAAD